MRKLLLILLAFSFTASIGQTPLNKLTRKKATTSSTTLLTGLVADWEANEVSGSAADSHGSHTGTVTGITQNVAGKLGTCYQYDRLETVPDATTGVVIGTSTDFNLASTTGSISVWINSTLEDYWGAAIVSTYNSDVDNSGYQLWLQADGGTGEHHIACTLGAAASSQTAAGTTVIDNSGSTWYHLVMTWNASGNIIAYINGVEEINTAVTITPVDAYDLTIGRGPPAYSPMWFDGKIDQVLIYNKVLSPAEVLELYNSGTGKPYPFTP